MEPFLATLPADPFTLRDLRTRIARWLEDEGINGSVRDGVVLAAHEAAASAIERSPEVVTIDAELAGRSLTIVVTSDRVWSSPERDHQGPRMRLLRALVSKVKFEAGPDRARMRLEKVF